MRGSERENDSKGRKTVKKKKYLTEIEESALYWSCLHLVSRQASILTFLTL